MLSLQKPESKNPYWINASSKNTAEVFRQTLMAFIDGKTITDCSKVTGLSRQSVTSAYDHIKLRFAAWNNIRINAFFGETGPAQCDLRAPRKEQLTRHRHRYYAEWYNRVKAGKCLKDRCRSCDGFQRMSAFRFMRYSFERYRGIEFTKFYGHCGLAFAREQALRSPKILSQTNDIMDERVSVHIFEKMEDWFLRYPIGSPQLAHPTVDYFGPYRSYDEELWACFSPYDENERLKKFDEARSGYAVPTEAIIISDSCENQFVGSKKPLFCREILGVVAGGYRSRIKS